MLLIWTRWKFALNISCSLPRQIKLWAGCTARRCHIKFWNGRLKGGRVWRSVHWFNGITHGGLDHWFYFEVCFQLNFRIKFEKQFHAKERLWNHNNKCSIRSLRTTFMYTYQQRIKFLAIVCACGGLFIENVDLFFARLRLNKFWPDLLHSVLFRSPFQWNWKM